ncbi:cellulase family glycosylhydrolase [bacterium]|nr:cellulase family glycosylhydrolase [bacterium]
MKALLLFLLFLSPGWIERRGPQLVCQDQPVHFRGMCLGNWWVPEGYMLGLSKATSPTQIERGVLELLGPEESRAFWEGYRDHYVSRADLELLARSGFNAVRVPLHWKYLREERELQRLDWLISECRRLNLWVLPDLHAAPGGQTGDNIDDGASYPWLFESAESRRLACQLWREVALRYRDEPTVMGWELLNEPIPNWPGYDDLHPKLDEVYREMGAAIREVDSRHVLFLDGAEWATNFKAVSSDWDSGLALAFHRYWADPQEIGPYLALRRSRGVPLLMSESGENDDRWLTDFRARLDKEDVSWFFWPYKKMKTESCVALVKGPAGWDKVMAWMDALGLEGEARRKLRPSRAEARAAFAELLENVKLENCSVQEHFVRALLPGD